MSGAKPTHRAGVKCANPAQTEALADAPNVPAARQEQVDGVSTSEAAETRALHVRPVLHSGPVSDLGTALVGGAIGSAITIVAGQFARARVAWSEITVHDSLAAEANEQLFVWVDDRTRGLATEMRDVTEQFNARGAFHSSPHAQALAEAKARVLHEYRDQEWRARMRLSELAAAEGGWHLAWRLLRRRSAPALTATDTVEPFLQRWREPVRRHESQPDAGAPVFDRTSRTSEEAVSELPGLPLT